MVTKMRKSITVFALAAVICLIAAVFSVELIRTSYASEADTPVAEFTFQSDGDWSKAVEKAQSVNNRENNLVKITLSCNWIAQNGSFGSGAGFEDGRIVVPSNANILLDLNGKVINRALTSAVLNGSVIDVKGSLTVCDGAPTNGNSEYTYNSVPIEGGIVTGGCNAGFGGAISVAGGATLNVTGGTLLNNAATYGGGIGVYRGESGASINISGGSILGNVGTGGGGGLYIANAKLDVGGAPVRIEGNTATKGGAIIIASSDSSVRIGNAVLKDNRATSQGLAFGGGVYVKQGSLSISGNAEITSNTAAFGGGVYAENADARFSVSGNAKVYENRGVSAESNNVYLADGAKINVGKLEDGANIRISNISEKQVFTQGYASNNSVAGYAEDPAKHIALDDGKHVLLNSDGEAVVSNQALTWGFMREGETAYQTETDYGISNEYDPAASAVTKVKINGTEHEVNIKNVADSTVIKQTIDGIEVAISVIVTPKSIEGMTVSGIGDVQTFSVSYPNISLAGLRSNTDYAVTFNDNRFVGGCSLTVTGMGNYAGKIVRNYTVTPDTGKTYDVSWEYFDGSAWRAVPENGEIASFDGTVHNDKVRAKLTIQGETSYVEYAYAQGVIPQDTQDYNGNLSVTFEGTFASAAVNDLLNATTYTAMLGGNGNVGMPSNVTTEVKISKAESLALTADDFASFFDADGNPLWLLYGGAEALDYVMESSADVCRLIGGEGLVYVDGTGSANGDVNAHYARYTGTELQVVLNGDYKVKGKSISSYLQGATVAYNGSKTIGEMNKLGEVNTSVTITVSDNYQTATTPITLNFKWNVVTVNNALRFADGSVIVGSDFGVWTYGDNLDDYAISKSFRSEHGDTVVLTFTDVSSGKVVGRFAIVYAGNTANYYEVKQDGAIYVPDTDKSISSKYFSEYLDSVPYGEYVLNVYVPQVTLGDHDVWWGGASVVGQTTYYALSSNFTFAVRAFEFASNGVLSPELYCNISNKAVPYNGSANNTPKIELRHINGRVFVEGVDYELVSDNKNVGVADLTIKGIGSLNGQVTLAGSYEIVKTTNRWLNVPLAVGWDYKQYNRNVNLITATPELLDNSSDLRFTVTTDAEGNNPVQGLEQFYLTADGYVSDVSAQTLQLLPVGRYYLFAYVSGNGNYEQLSQAGVPFDVKAAANSWKTAPGINTWIEGKFNAIDNLPYAEAVEGNDNAVYVIIDANGNVVYDTANGINNLINAPAGTYNLTVTVPADSDGNYSALATITPVTFSIYPKAGLPWWAVLILVVGALLVAALMLFILAKLGVFRIMTRKLTVAIRTKATVDATIAAVRANKIAAEAKKSVALAKARDREAQRQAERESMLAMSAEERANALSLKAKEEALRAERIRVRANEVQAEADALKKQAEQELAAAKSNKSND